MQIQTRPLPLYTVVYDGTCDVCIRVAKAVQAWDRHSQLEVVPLHSPGVMARFPWIPPQAYADALQLIGPGGRTWEGTAAIEQLLRVLPRGELISWVFVIPFARRIAERLYRWFARNRYHLGCDDHCRTRMP
jgi:predicted DCC family thiol-disulfide oxidoreductase YuxK